MGRPAPPAASTRLPSAAVEAAHLSFLPEEAAAAGTGLWAVAAEVGLWQVAAEAGLWEVVAEVRL